MEIKSYFANQTTTEADVKMKEAKIYNKKLFLYITNLLRVDKPHFLDQMKFLWVQ